MPRSLGEVLAKARTQAGLSLRDVEGKTGIQNAHLSQIEKGGITKPAVGILWKLANAYDLDFSKLLQLAGHAGKTSGKAPVRSLAGAGLHTIEDLTPHEERELLDFLEQLRKRRTEE